MFLYSLTRRELITSTAHSCQTLSYPVTILYGATLIRVNSHRGPNFYSSEITFHQNNISTFSSNTKDSAMCLSTLYWEKVAVHINMLRGLLAEILMLRHMLQVGTTRLQV